MTGVPTCAASPLAGVIFDLDGTLTVPVIDFADMRRRLDLPTGDILAALKQMPHDRRTAALHIIEEIEEEARARMCLQPGALELLADLTARRIRMGIVTRNTARTVRHLVELTGDVFSAVVTRDFLPVKPDPEPVLHICRQWALDPARTLMVGDYRDDLLCGRAAGARTCLLRNAANGAYAGLADWVVDSLSELRVRLAAEGAAPVA